ncbi:Retrovirus-related Pol polyprotein from transposon 297 [Araneus ventricosus]|uniref:Retrovirus-related Pol polyprotein from transposon 297 n=1 Tax=Araneus ventricosus TaxID=182803 RepID=A0A4Y2AEP0_ARAVE|nr:Retrovirus-related Pol polyprotein from transposon 297 [Araneus ventricosus]
MRLQKSGESLQVAAAYVERLMSLAYAKCSQDVRDSLAAQYFLDAIRDEDPHDETRLMDAKDLKSSLAYIMKYETAKTASKTSRNVRSIEIEDGTGIERDEKFDCLLKTLEKLLNSDNAGKKNTPRRNPNVTCWKCNGKRARTERVPDDFAQPGKIMCGRLTGPRLSFLNKVPEKRLKVSALCGGRDGLYLEDLFAALITFPILTYPLTDKQFILDTDASNEGIGAVLSQKIGNEECVIAYFSKSLGKPERNYCVTRKELLAIVKFIEHFHHYLYGQKFLLGTDNGSLRWLLNFREPEGRIACWIQRLQEYDFEIQHRKGISHENADVLSRRPCKESCKHCMNAEKKFEMEKDIFMKVLTTEYP